MNRQSIYTALQYLTTIGILDYEINQMIVDSKNLNYKELRDLSAPFTTKLESFFNIDDVNIPVSSPKLQVHEYIHKVGNYLKSKDEAELLSLNTLLKDYIDLLDRVKKDYSSTA